MPLSEEDIKWAKENQQLQLLYSVVNSSMKDVEETADKELKEKIINFKDNLISLIEQVSGNGISSAHLSKYLVVLIHILLTKKETTELANINISNIHKHVEQIVNAMTALHILCKEEVFRSALCKIQAGFATDCIVNTQAPAYNLRRQLQLWQLHLSRGESDPAFSKAQQQVKEIQNHIEQINSKTQQAREFCEKFKIS